MWIDIRCEVQGRTHVAYGVPCQDKTYFLNHGEVSAIALADGAGSAKFSHFGAEHVTKKICKYLCENFDTVYTKILEKDANIKHYLINIVCAEFSILSAELNCKIKDLASTLLAVAVKGDRYILLHLGDGVIGCVRGKKLEILSMPTNGEYVNITYFTTSENATRVFKTKAHELLGITSFIMMSDGAMDGGLYDVREEKLVNTVKQIADYSRVESLDEIRAGVKELFETRVMTNTTDDCSIAVLSEIVEKETPSTDKEEANIEEQQKEPPVKEESIMSEKAGTHTPEELDEQENDSEFKMEAGTLNSDKKE